MGIREAPLAAPPLELEVMAGAEVALELRPVIPVLGDPHEEGATGDDPRISMVFFLRDRKVKRTGTKGSTLTTKEVRRRLKTASQAIAGKISELIKRYDLFTKEVLAEEGFPSPPEAEDGGGQQGLR